MPNHALAQTTPRVIDALRDATRSRHSKLASSPAMRRLFDDGYRLSEYREHLGRLLGLFEPLEQSIARVTDSADPSTIGPACALNRAAALREDLSMMGASDADIQSLDRCCELPTIAAEGLPGYTYVMLGSMLGAKIIVERLIPVLGPKASYSFYGNGIGRSEILWASFCSDLEQNEDSDVDEICATANAVFDAYAEWVAEPCSRAEPYPIAVAR